MLVYPYLRDPYSCPTALSFVPHFAPRFPAHASYFRARQLRLNSNLALTAHSSPSNLIMRLYGCKLLAHRNHTNLLLP